MSSPLFIRVTQRHLSRPLRFKTSLPDPTSGVSWPLDCFVANSFCPSPATFFKELFYCFTTKEQKQNVRGGRGQRCPNEEERSAIVFKGIMQHKSMQTVGDTCVLLQRIVGVAALGRAERVSSKIFRIFILFAPRNLAFATGDGSYRDLTVPMC